MNVRGVVLYSGRWNTVETPILNHKKFLINPLRLDVVAVGYKENLCEINSNIFEKVVTKLWDMSSERLLVKMINNDESYKKKK